MALGGLSIERPFFFRKIERGLSFKRQILSILEEDFLLASRKELKALHFTPGQAKQLVARCKAALGEMYTQEVTAQSSEQYNMWRNQNVDAWKHSDRMLDCFVQNWYITAGHKLERRIHRTRPLYTWYSPPALILWDNWFNAHHKR